MGRSHEESIGRRFGRLTVLGVGEPRINPGGGMSSRMRCECDCGNLTTIDTYSLRRGLTRSCGCLRSERTRELSTTHGQTTGGRASAPYKHWISIKERVVTGTASSPECYINRGITMYGPWVDDFQAFYTWIKENLGDRPAGKTLDRINNDGNYEPGNLRWATQKEQCNNTRRNKFISYNGATLTVSQWEEQLGFSRDTLRQRIFKLGWPVEKAFTTPIGGHK